MDGAYEPQRAVPRTSHRPSSRPGGGMPVCPRTMSLPDATESIDTHSGAAFSCNAWEESQSDESSQEVSTVISGLNY